MADLRLYRLAFIPALAALVVLAFSLRGVPSPVEPPPGTLEFDAASAAKSTRDVLAVGGSRAPGSEEDNAVADLVAERFGSVVTGSLGEQTVKATIDGEETELRNVLLTLPGESDHAIVVIAGRDTREGEGAPSSAAATGVLLELMNQLSVAGRNRTLILASTSAASAEGQGARELIEALPGRNTVDAVIVISQPGFDEPFTPHLVMAGGLNGPPVGLAQTAAEILRDRANLSPGMISMPAQIARYAIPAAAGEQAGLIEDGLDAVTLSSAGELPLPASENGRERLDTETLARMGPALLALVSALDASTSAPASGPGNFLWTGDNLLPGWSVGLVVLALLLPPLAVAASVLARAVRDGGHIGRAFSWAIEWWLPALVVCLGIYGLAVLDVIPSSGIPYDPSRFGFGASEAIGLILLVAFAAWLWWVLHLRRIPSPPGPLGGGAAAGLTAVAASIVVWLANPYLALLLVPLVHLVAVLGTQGRRPAALALPVLALAAAPLAVALIYVASELDWGASTPLQLAALMAGGGIGPVQAIGCVFTLSSVAAVATAALATVRANQSSGAEDLTEPEIRG
ncbi:MAG: hypothetical protein QOI31_1101 [Solirubrobacterales bacterium]|nr:hypothetical protein [Solirubrobacterales bacterium]